MTLFEYLSIAFSLVFSFSAMRILGGLAHVLDGRRRYWVHVIFVVCTLFVTAVGFWNLWNFRDAEWSLAQFFLVLSIPGALYFVSCALVPENAAAIPSWHDYYYEVRRRYFAGLAVLIAAISVSQGVVLEVPLLSFARTPQWIAGSVAIAGLASTNERLHAGLALCILAGLITASVMIFAVPDFLLRA